MVAQNSSLVPWHMPSTLPVLVRRGETVKLIAPFHQPAGRTLPFMYHCHILEHEDNGMMGQFTVTET